MAITLATDGSQATQGEKVVGGGWQQLIAPTPTSKCLRVGIMAPRTGTTKNGTNTGDIFVCLSVLQPTNLNGGWAISSDGTRDRYFHVGDASNVWLFGLNAGDVVEYSIER